MTYTYCICMVEIQDGVLLCIFPAQRCHIGSSKLVMVPWKLENATDQGWIYCFVDCLEFIKWWQKYYWCRVNLKLCDVCSWYIMHSPKIEDLGFRCLKLLSNSTKTSPLSYSWGLSEVLTCFCCSTVVWFIDVANTSANSYVSTTVMPPMTRRAFC